MIRLVAAMSVLAFAMCAPAWAQERRQRHELRQEQKLAERPEIDAPDLDVEEAPEAGENDSDTARVFTTDDLEGLDETPEAAPGESSEGAELIDPRSIPPDAGRPEASAIPGGPTFQEQMSRLVLDLRYDRTSGRDYARAPERGSANSCWPMTAGRRRTSSSPAGASHSPSP
jgi:hypothetical protein